MDIFIDQITYILIINEYIIKNMIIITLGCFYIIIYNYLDDAKG